MSSLIIFPSGHVTCVYAEDLDLSAIGPLHIRRASHVEPDETGRWWANLSPVDGPALGPFQLRRLAVEAEVTWLEANVLAGTRRPVQRRCSVDGL